MTFILGGLVGGTIGALLALKFLFWMDARKQREAEKALKELDDASFKVPLKPLK